MFGYDFKLIIAIAAVILTLIGYYPYLRDIFQRKTKPHLYTWLIWAITLSTATLALWYGGGNFGVIGLATGVLFVILVFFLSFKYGTRNITRSDTAVLIAALSAVVIWWKLDNPFLAVLMVSIIDGLGYIPTFRKSFQEPWSETISFWALMATGNILTIISSTAYNFLTLAYLTTLTVANIIVFLICLTRRKSIPRSIQKVNSSSHQ